MDTCQQRFEAALKAHAQAVAKNTGLHIKWSDEYRRLLNQAVDHRIPLTERVEMFEVLCAREANLGAAARIEKTLAEHGDRLKKEEAEKIEQERKEREREELEGLLYDVEMVS